MGTLLFWYLFAGWCIAFVTFIFNRIDDEEVGAPGDFVITMVTAPAMLLIHLTLAAFSWYNGLLSIDSREDDQR